MARYLVQIYDRDTCSWRTTRGDTITASGYDLTYPFSNSTNATNAIKEWRDKSLTAAKKEFRIINETTKWVVWQTGGTTTHPAGEEGEPLVMENPIQLEKPLVLKRQDVIGRLEYNLKKEQEKRQKAEEKEKNARNDFRQLLLDHEEQIVNFVKAHLSSGSWADATEKAEKIFEKDEQYKTPESKPGRLEDELEKFVRVLRMGAEDTIEVKPTQAVYDLM